MYEKKTIIGIMVFLLALLTISFVSARVEYFPSVVNTYFKNLISVQPGLTEDTVIYNFTNPRIKILKTKKGSVEFIDEFTRIKGKKVSSTDYYILKNVLVDEPVYTVNSTKICYYNASSCFIQNDTIQTTITSIKQQWIPFDPNNHNFKPKKTNTIKAVFHHPPSLGKRAIDWIPSIKENNKWYTQRKWAWFNTTFGYSHDLNISNMNSNVALPGLLDHSPAYTVNVSINHSNFVDFGAQADGSDFHVVWGNSTAQTGVEINISNLTAWNLANTNISFMLMKNISANSYDTNYSFYYNATNNNPQLSNGKGVFAFYDNFSDNVSTDWSQVSGVWSEQDNVMRFTSGSGQIVDTTTAFTRGTFGLEATGSITYSTLGTGNFRGIFRLGNRSARATGSGKGYEFREDGSNLQIYVDNTSGYWLCSQTAITLTDTTLYPFTVTANSTSVAISINNVYLACQDSQHTDNLYAGFFSSPKIANWSAIKIRLTTENGSNSTIGTRLAQGTPLIQQTIINATSTLNRSVDDLTVFVNPSTANTTARVWVNLFKNNVLSDTIYNQVKNNTLEHIYTLTSGNTSINDIWIAEIWTETDTQNSTSVNSSITISGAAPYFTDNSINTTTITGSISDDVFISALWFDEQNLSYYQVNSNITGQGNMSLNRFNEANASYSNLTFYVNGTHEGTDISFILYANDSDNVWNSTQENLISIGNSSPTIDSAAIASGCHQRNDTIIFSWIQTDNGIINRSFVNLTDPANIYYEINSGNIGGSKGKRTATSGVVSTDMNYHFNQTGTWKANITVIDWAGNLNHSSTLTFDIVSSCGSGGGGGGGGGGGIIKVIQEIPVTENKTIGNITDTISFRASSIAFSPLIGPLSPLAILLFGGAFYQIQKIKKKKKPFSFNDMLIISSFIIFGFLLAFQTGLGNIIANQQAIIQTLI